MALSIGKQQTTLYDQFEYAGAPESFAWVLPTKGIVQIGLSSDAVFNLLDGLTGVTVMPVSPYCPCPGGSSSSSSSSSSSGGGSVDVVASEVVGPYETVQLSSNDPQALSNWLAGHGYTVPEDIKPLIATYVAEKFNFLALKLVPGNGIKAMRPVRITTPGGSPTLPLRMVAAGTGVTTLATLWVIAEGRYEPANAPWFVIDPFELVWDWNTSSSNYKALRAQKFAASKGLAWQIETAGKQSVDSFTNVILSLQPDKSGYGGGDPNLVQKEAQEDMDALFAGMAPSSVWVTRMRGELARPAFDKDLQLQASASQAELSGMLIAPQSTGDPPCPCSSSSSSSGQGSSGGGYTGSSSGVPAGGGEGGGGLDLGAGGGVPHFEVSADDGGCALGSDTGHDDPGLLFVGLIAALLALSRRGDGP